MWKFVIFTISILDVALFKKTKQSSTFAKGNNVFTSDKAIDGNKNTNVFAHSCSHTIKEQQPWLEVDLGNVYNITGVEITNRGDCCGDRLKNFTITVDTKL